MLHQTPSNVAWPARVPDPREIPIRDFNRHRQDFLRSFGVWLTESADPAAALLELESTVNATRGLVALAFDELEDHPLITGGSAVRECAR